MFGWHKYVASSFDSFTSWCCSYFSSTRWNFYFWFHVFSTMWGMHLSEINSHYFPFPHTRATKPFQQVYLDLCGKISTRSITDKHCSLVITNISLVSSRQNYYIWLPHKSTFIQSAYVHFDETLRTSSISFSSSQLSSILECVRSSSFVLYLVYRKRLFVTLMFLLFHLLLFLHPLEIHLLTTFF